MFSRNRSKKSLLIRSTLEIRGEQSAKLGRKKHYLTHEFEVLFNKINNIREWTKNLIKDSMAIISLEEDMNIRGYLEDSEKKHLGQTKLEVLGDNMVKAAKGSGIKGGTYEKALIKVGECEQLLGTYGKDYIVDVCSSFIRPLKYFLDVELNKLVEEKEMLTSRKIDFDYHVKQINSGKTDKNVVHKLKMAEMALEFQYIHAKEVLQGIEASECQVGHLSDLISVQSVYHQKCLAELEKLKIDLQKMSSNTESEKQSSETSKPARKVSNPANKRSSVEGNGLKGSPPLAAKTRNVLKEPAKMLDSLKGSGPRLSEEQFQTRERNDEGTDHYGVKRSGGSCPRMRSMADKQSNQRKTESPVKDCHKSKNLHKTPAEHKPPHVGNVKENSLKLLNEPLNKECSNRRTGTNVVTHNIHCRPRCKPVCHHRVGDQSQDSPATEGFSTDESSTSKETHVIPIPVRNNYRRDVGKIYFTPRQDLE